VAPLTLDLSSAAGDVTIGSPIALSVTFNKPLAPGSTVTLEPLVDNETVPPIDWDTNAAAGSAVGHWVARQSLHFRVRAIDGDGFANSAIEEYQILVHPDRPPSVQFEKPTENEDVTPQAIIPLQAMAEDDYGIKTMQLVIRRLSDQKQWTQDLITNGQPVSSAVGWQLVDATADLRRFRMNWSWELDKLDAAPPKVGDQFEYYLRVQDSFVDYNGKPHNPPFSESGHLRLTIISQESLVSEIMDRLSELRTETNTVRQKNEEVRIATKNVIDDTHGQKSLDKADKMLVAQLNNDQSSAASQTEQISSKLDDLLSRLSENRSPDTDLSGNISQAKVLLNDVAGNLMKEAMTRLSDLHDYDHPADARNTEFDQTQSFQSQASDELHQAMDKMGSDTGVAQFIKRVDDLLNAQRAISAQTANAGRSMLGKDPTQLTPNEQKTLGALSQQQQDLQHQVDAAMKDMSNAADKQARTDPDSAAALRQAVTTGQTQDVSGNMGQAAQAVSSNQQSQAQSSQQQAELGLLMILRQLQEADNRRLASLIKQLEDAQQLLADLIQQQSSHNLDNLAIQGPPAVKAAAAADPELIEDLNNYAGRDPKNPPAVPTLNTLITLQAQTEHNTRNVIPVIEALPEGAEPAAHLTRAAQEMSRAVVHLMDSQLVDAYQPPQVEALEALLQAKDNVDAQHDKALQQLGQQQKESIRQEFIKIRDEQVKIDRMTKTAGAAPKAPDGSIAHEAKALLGILSIQQGKLADRASKLDQDLISLGSIAYTYANDDIVSQMNGVKDHLNAFEAGLPTQKSQARIVAELDDMIKELAIKPKISDFAQGGGGGGGQCAPHLPTEAEIRLIRDLQKGVNDDTKDADAQSPHDKQAILELGKREGDLRQLLDHILQKASGGQLKLGSEPSNKDTLPEEASNEDLDLEELRDQALNAKPDAQGESDDTGLVGLRMARAHQRLALNLDPGQTTQRIQARILLNLDALAEMARQEEATGRPRQGQPGQPQQANPNQGRPVNPNNTGQGMASRGPKSGQGGTTPAGDSTNGGPGLTDEDINASIQQLKNNWGAISPRQRAAIMESASERTLTQFKTFVDGYYRTLADKATQQ
ncbi:MAG TPA: hypothetical protein VMD30_02880, partial [Tepidisphaeraceae bacterium]|nr:hypothetical protein [Tepidisphaeraceae bacterium]